MSDEQNLFLRQLRADFAKYIVGFMFTVIVGLVAFYFNTKNVTAQNAREIEQLKQTKANKELYEQTVKDINRQLIEIKQDIKELRK